MAIKISNFLDLDAFKSHMDDMLLTLRATLPEASATSVLVPGDPEHQMEEHRRQHGIPLHLSQHREIFACAEQVGAKFLI